MSPPQDKGPIPDETSKTKTDQVVRDSDGNIDVSKTGQTLMARMSETNCMKKQDERAKSYKKKQNTETENINLLEDLVKKNEEEVKARKDLESKVAHLEEKTTKWRRKCEALRQLLTT